MVKTTLETSENLGIGQNAADVNEADESLRSLSSIVPKPKTSPKTSEEDLTNMYYLAAIKLEKWKVDEKRKFTEQLNE
jgi:hypothetical protein